MEHGIDSAAELLLVEGDSAAKAACLVRSYRFQAVLPMQGKPLNAWKASREAVQKNLLYSALVQALGTGWEEACQCASARYSKVVLLFDPDADGIHCGVLLLQFFYRWLRPYLEENHLFLVQAPLVEFTTESEATKRYAYSEDEQAKTSLELAHRQIPFAKKRYRGLASMSADTLERCCIDPKTRVIRSLGVRDAEASFRFFG